MNLPNINDTKYQKSYYKIHPIYWANSKVYISDILISTRFLSKHEQKRSSKFIKYEDKECYIISHYFLKKVISEVLNVRILDVEFQVSQFGKPFLINKEFDFNLSHSKNFFAFTIGNSPDMKVGIDIEYVNSNLDFLGIIDSYFNREENAYIMNLEYDRDIRFYEIWTRKEAVLKMLGIGLIDNLADLNVTPGTTSIKINIPEIDINYDEQIFLYTFIMDNFVLSACFNQPVQPVLKEIQ